MENIFALLCYMYDYTLNFFFNSTLYTIIFS